MIGKNISPGNGYIVSRWEWWQFEIDARMQAFAGECANLGSLGHFGVFDADMPTAEGGLAKRFGSGESRGVFRPVTLRRHDWLKVTEVLRWEERPGLWQFGESLVLADREDEEQDADGYPGVGLFEKLDYLLRRAVNRLALEADGLQVYARVGWMIRAGVMTFGVKIDALRPFTTPEEVDTL